MIGRIGIAMRSVVWVAGAIWTMPSGVKGDAPAVPVAVSYAGTNSTIAHRIMEVEARIQVVPPRYNTLDAIVDRACQSIRVRPSYSREEALDVLRAIDRTLVENNFIYGETTILIQALQPVKLQPGMLRRDLRSDVKARALQRIGKECYLGDCDIFCYLYLAVGNRLNLPMHAVSVPGHMFIRWRVTASDYIDWETTAGMEATDSFYISDNAISERSIQNGAYMKDMSETELIGCAYMNLGYSWLEENELDKAVGCLRKAIELHPRCFPAYRVLARILKAHMREGTLASYDELLAVALKAVPLDPSTGSDLHRFIAMGYYQKWETDRLAADREAAVFHFRQVLATGSTDEDVQTFLKRLDLFKNEDKGAMAAREKKEAMDNWRQERERDVEIIDDYTFEKYFLPHRMKLVPASDIPRDPFEHETTEEKKRRYTGMIEANPRDFRTRLSRGTLLMDAPCGEGAQAKKERDARLREALADFEYIIRHGDTTQKAYVQACQRGSLCHHALGDHGRAVSILETAVKQRPRNGDLSRDLFYAYEARAAAAMEGGAPLEALADYDRIQARWPTAWMYEARSKAWKRLGNRDAWLANSEKAQEWDLLRQSEPDLERAEYDAWCRATGKSGYHQWSSEKTWERQRRWLLDNIGRLQELVPTHYPWQGQTSYRRYALNSTSNDAPPFCDGLKIRFPSTNEMGFICSFGIKGIESWGLLPASGGGGRSPLRPGRVVLSADVPAVGAEGDRFVVFSATTDGELSPEETTYILWFDFEDDAPVNLPVSLYVNYLPMPSPATLERLFGPIRQMPKGVAAGR